MGYATYEDVEARLGRQLTESEQAQCETYLEDAAVIIDTFNINADIDNKKIVSCRMVMRVMGSGEDIGVPMGATQGSMSGLGYAQSWTISNGASGEIYLSKTDKQLLGYANKIGSYSPVQELAGGDNS
jgi:hypothetical protein